MVLKVEPIYKAVEAIKKASSIQRAASSKKSNKLNARVILFSPRGKKFNQKTAKRLAKYDQLIFICGRYEGVDERVAKYIADEVVSIGDYVLNGGEVAAMAVIEAVSRMIPGFIAKQESAEKLDHAQYTRPEAFEAKSDPEKLRNGASKRKTKNQIWQAPRVLLSGDHKKIAEWRTTEARNVRGNSEKNP